MNLSIFYIIEKKISIVNYTVGDSSVRYFFCIITAIICYDLDKTIMRQGFFL